MRPFVENFPFFCIFLALAAGILSATFRSGRAAYRMTLAVTGTIAVLYGINIFLGANGLPNYLVGMSLLIDLAVGLVVACTVYGFYALFARGEL